MSKEISNLIDEEHKILPEWCMLSGIDFSQNQKFLDDINMTAEQFRNRPEFSILPAINFYIAKDNSKTTKLNRNSSIYFSNDSTHDANLAIAMLTKHIDETFLPFLKNLSGPKNIQNRQKKKKKNVVSAKV